MKPVLTADGNPSEEMAPLERELLERYECASVLPAAYDPLAREGLVTCH